MNEIDSTLPGRNGVTLHCSTSSPSGTSRGHVVIAHGYGEHSGRYGHVVERFNAEGLTVSRLDHRGHGKTTGVPRGVIDDFSHLVDDLEMFVEHVSDGEPVTVFGHSMGGLATVRLLERTPPTVRQAIVTGASIQAAGSIPKPLVKLANQLGKFAPNLGTIVLDGNAISRDPKVRADYETDPLNYRGKVSAGTARQMNIAMQQALRAANIIAVPLLICHGGSDELTHPNGSRVLAETVSSTDVTLKIFDGWYHELHNEPERDEALDVFVEWIVERL